MIPLSQVPIGKSVRLAAIEGGRLLSKRLLGLGIAIGSEMEVLHQRSSGVVVARDGNRVALGAGVAEKLLTEEIL